METCPECNKQSLVYDPHTRSARCLNIQCPYREEMGYAEYSKRFEKEEKNVVHKLAFSRNHAITPT